MAYGKGHDVMEVATPQGWQANPAMVLDFYNKRRKDAMHAQPNPAHLALAGLQAHFEVSIITQNVDNLHERAGSDNVIHLHGELFKTRSCVDESLVYALEGWEIKLGDLCEKGSQLRPHIVWFGELVPLMESAIAEAMRADELIVVGTSLLVYPAAGLLDYAPQGTSVYMVDPHISAEAKSRRNIKSFEEKASTGVPKIVQLLKQKYNIS